MIDAMFVHIIQHAMYSLSLSLSLSLASPSYASYTCYTPFSFPGASFRIDGCSGSFGRGAVASG